MENKFTELASEYGVMLKKMPNGYQFRDDKFIINYYDSTGTLVMHIKGESKSIVNKKAGMFFLKECLNDCFWAKPKSLNDQYAEIEGVRQSMVKEYLDSNYVLREVKCTSGDNRVPSDWIEIPEGAIKLMHPGYRDDLVHFINEYGKLMSTDDIRENRGYWYESDYYSSGCFATLWSRFTQPDELPFIDDEPKLEDIELNPLPKHSHYFKDVSDVAQIDVYDVLLRFGVTDPCLQHIVKKALCAGNRGHKDFERDLQDIHDTAKRALEIHGV